MQDRNDSLKAFRTKIALNKKDTKSPMSLYYYLGFACDFKLLTTLRFHTRVCILDLVSLQNLDPLDVFKYKSPIKQFLVDIAAKIMTSFPDLKLPSIDIHRATNAELDIYFRELFKEAFEAENLRPHRTKLVIIPPDTQVNNITVDIDSIEYTREMKAAAFKKIYRALYEGQSGLFKGTSPNKYDSLNYTEICFLKVDDERLKKAKQLAEIYYHQCHNENEKLFAEIYKFAFAKSCLFSVSKNTGHSIFAKETIIRSEEVKPSIEHADKHPHSRTAKIMRALGEKDSQHVYSGPRRQ